MLPFYSSRSDKLVKCDPFHICSQSVYAKDRLWASIFFLSLFCFTRFDVRSILIRRRGRRRSEKLGFEIETVRRGKHEEKKKHGKKLHEWKIEIPPFHPRKGEFSTCLGRRLLFTNRQEKIVGRVRRSYPTDETGPPLIQEGGGMEKKGGVKFGFRRETRTWRNEKHDTEEEGPRCHVRDPP